MAQIVAAYAASHAPILTAAPESAPKEQLRNLSAAFAQLREDFARARPEAVIVFANDHFTNLFYDRVPPFLVGIAERHEGPVEDWLRIEKRWVTGHPDLARFLVEQGSEHGVDLAFSEELELDHGIMVGLHFLDPEGHVPVVPLIQNCSIDPMPAPRRCYALGRYLRRAVEAYQGVERVALLGQGGLSHWVGMAGMGRINDTWDRHVLDLLAKGRGAEIATWSREQIEVAGNGAHEIRSWLTLAGAMEGTAKAEVLAYEPVASFVTGMGVMRYTIG
jgi:aromatic ring-opening dioxygenase catalytic subunit (LigB family)